jgi:hypothetical protein
MFQNVLLGNTLPRILKYSAQTQQSIHESPYEHFDKNGEFGVDKPAWKNPRFSRSVEGAPTRPKSGRLYQAANPISGQSDSGVGVAC